MPRSNRRHSFDCTSSVSSDSSDSYKCKKHRHSSSCKKCEKETRREKICCNKCYEKSKKTQRPCTISSDNKEDVSEIINSIDKKCGNYIFITLK